MRRFDLILLGTTLILVLFGLFMIYDASSYVAFRDFGDKYHYIKDQMLWVVIGFSALSITAFFDYRKLYNLSLPFLIGAIFLLILVFVPGLGVSLLGARRWVDLGFTYIQPSEFVKLSLALYLSAWFSTNEKGRFPAFILLLGTIIFLVIAQPDMGTAVIITAIGLGIYFLSGANMIHFIALIPAILLGGLALIKLEPYRAQRLTTFLDPTREIEGASYHVRQILIALGSGGLMGVGAGNSLQKYAYLPESTTDSIFAIVGEEFGFLGGVILVLLFSIIAIRGFHIATHAKDKFGKLLAGGITIFLSSQAMINLAAQTALVPLTGIPLPFISYGGSALIVNLVSIGILLSIGRSSQK